MTKAIVTRLESVNLRLWQEAIKFEKLRNLIDDLEVKCANLDPKEDDRYLERVTAQSKACEAMRKFSWELAGMDEKSQELTYLIDTIVDDIGDI